MNTKEIHRATGRRKCSVAQVRLSAGTGKFKINGRAFDEYFRVESLRGYIQQPLLVTSQAGKFDVDATIKGGGVSGQAAALRHGIARSLLKFDQSLRKNLKDSGMLTCDSRVKERKKSGQPGARKRFQFSKR